MADAQAALLVTLLALLHAQAGDPDRRGVISRLASRATDAVTDVVDPDVIIEKVDVDSIIQRVDVDALVQRVDVDALVQRIDMDGLVARIDIDELVHRVDVDGLIRRVDIDQLIKEVDVDALLEQVDVNQLLDRVDVDRLLDRVDADRLLDRVDVDRLMDRVDVNAIVDRVDIEEIVERAGIPEIVRESTGHMAGSMIDVGRRQVVGVDQLAGRVTYRIIGRDNATRPTAPESLSELDERIPGSMTGHYAGPISRFLAWAADLGIIWGVYLLITGAIALAAFALFDLTIENPLRTGAWAAAAFATWSFLYEWIGTAISGRTIGRRLVGLRIVERDGTPLQGRHAFVRALVRPLSFLFAGLGCLGVVISPERRAFHDAVAGSAVVYDWGGRSAGMPAPLTAFLSRHNVDLSDPDL